MFEPKKKTDRKYTTFGSLPVQGEQKIKKKYDGTGNVAQLDIQKPRTCL